jgi:CheY-like chemotaxis protein
LYSELLAWESYVVIAAVNGLQAELRATVKLAFDLLISDFNMPGMNGVELALRLTLRQPDLPVPAFQRSNRRIRLGLP